MSARSLGEVNVQVILEALDGGGNSTTAGGKVAGMPIRRAVRQRLLGVPSTLILKSKKKSAPS